MLRKYQELCYINVRSPQMSSALIIIPLIHSEALDGSTIARVLTTHLDCLTVWANVSWCPVRQGLNMHGHQSLPLPLLAQQEYLHPQEYSNGKSQLHTHPVRRWPTAIDTYCKGIQECTLLVAGRERRCSKWSLQERNYPCQRGKGVQ